MRNEHRAAADTLGHALALGDGVGWEAFSAVVEIRLEPQERVSLAWAVMRSLDHDHVAPVAEDAARHIGMPMPPLFGALDEAESWAAMAAPEELDAVAVSAVKRMTRGRRQAFARYLAGVAV